MDVAQLEYAFPNEFIIVESISERYYCALLIAGDIAILPRTAIQGLGQKYLHNCSTARCTCYNTATALA